MPGRVPDALILSTAAKQGERMFDRVARICEIAEPILGVDRAAGQRAWIRKQPHGRLFITREPADSLFFPRDHARSGQPRYRWERQADGSEFGWLMEQPTDGSGPLPVVKECQISDTCPICGELDD